MSTIDFTGAVENATVRTRNVEMSYEADVTIPAEHFPEEFNSQQRVVELAVKMNHGGEFDRPGYGFSVGIVAIDHFSDSVTVSVVVKN